MILLTNVSTKTISTPKRRTMRTSRRTIRTPPRPDYIEDYNLLISCLKQDYPEIYYKKFKNKTPYFLQSMFVGKSGSTKSDKTSS